MKTFLLHHRHEPAECAVSFASWSGFVSPLRRHTTVSTCLLGGHAIWWCVEAVDVQAALEALPSFIARRTDVTEVRGVVIP